MPMFRYPGGKSRLIEPIAAKLALLPMHNYHDVFVGGGSVLVHTAKTYPKANLFANDLDKNIFSFWDLVASGSEDEEKQFVEMLKVEPTIPLFNKLRSETPEGRVRRAYFAVFFNRTTFSGIYTSGPIGGCEQKSKWTVNCRYNANRLIQEFLSLRKLMAGRLTVWNIDCIQYLKTMLAIEEEVPGSQTFYLDPPYFVKGVELYPCSMKPEQHVALADILRLHPNWVLSYDAAPEIEKLYWWAKREVLDARYSVNGVKDDWTKAKEFLYFHSST